MIGAGGDIEGETYDINSTAYIRIPFSIDSLEGLSSLTFRMKYDDGFIAYINGVEIASGNKPSSPAWNSDASTDHPDSQAISFVDTDLSTQALGLLKTGNNLLAIHSMNGDTRVLIFWPFLVSKLNSSFNLMRKRSHCLQNSHTFKFQPLKRTTIPNQGCLPARL